MPFDMPYSDLVERYGFIPANHTAPQFFPVKCRRLFDETGAELPGYKRIVREDTGDTLHVATDAYNLVENETAFGGFEEALRASSLDLTDMQVATDYAAYGARCFRQYMLPAHRVEVKPGVEVALRLLMLNSYDGSTTFRGMAGAYNFVCANTSIFGRDYASFAMRHTAGLDVPKAIAGLVSAAEAHVIETSRWKTWPRIGVSDADAIAVCKSLPRATESLTDHLVHCWVRARDGEGPQSGANLWCLYNVLTAWASHAGTEVQGGRGQARFDREKRVVDLMRGRAWVHLAGPAPQPFNNPLLAGPAHDRIAMVD